MLTKRLFISLFVVLGGCLPLVMGTATVSVSQTPTAPAPVAPTPPEVTLSNTYGATLPAASTPGREITLSLNPDGVAEMTTDYMNGDPTVVESGIWRVSNGQSVVRVTFDTRNGEALDTTSDIIFRVINGNLVAVVYDRTLYGSAGLVLEPR